MAGGGSAQMKSGNHPFHYGKYQFCDNNYIIRKISYISYF